ncbi:MAG: ATP synthase F0 subunit B [Candidatus Margulisbacteria bacterium]|nr:ATP synthase F0 subunit B [Candidatus Margulisiibacteriota bacterium]
MGSTNYLLILWNLIAFLLMLIIIRYAIWPKLFYYIEARRKKIESLQSSYERRNKEILDLTEKIKEESLNASERRKKILIDTKNECTTMRKDLIHKAHMEASSVLDMARLEIKKEKDKSFQEVRQDVSVIIAKSIKEVLYNIVDEDLDKRVIEEIKKVVTSVE